ncbi:MAG: hypothetical protein AABW46_00040 [Nanoarchaeota archaeon]
MNNKKVIISAVLILLFGLVSYNLSPSITGKNTVNEDSYIIIDKARVEEGGIITVTVLPGSSGIANDDERSIPPVYLDVYRLSDSDIGERVSSPRFKVCDRRTCYDDITRDIRIPSDIIPGFESSQRFYFRGIDGESGEEVRAYFTVTNKDKIEFDIHK